MGELIIHIDQTSGKVLKVQQKLDSNQQESLLKDQQGCTKEEIEKGIVTLSPMGNIYWDNSEEIIEIKKHRDTFDRIVSLPVELWEKKDNTVCTIVIGGVAHKCYH